MRCIRSPGKRPQRTLRRYCAPTLCLLMSCTLLSACSNMGVKPHQRGLLAKKSMLLVSDPVEAGLDDHIYFSKEASSGGRGFGGGGCGCN